ncbi:uncharacterized protein LOC134390055 [Cynocephalus volans]|uniref:uncharacterized protein LOC134390055 n=1 Tax=Cynocephalus volans TaxID=110931 RepID=UPI002FCA4511
MTIFSALLIRNIPEPPEESSDPEEDAASRAAKQKSATQEASDIATDSLRRRREVSRQAPATAHVNIQDNSPLQAPEFRGRRKRGDGRPTVPLNPSPPCLPIFSESPCHTTSSSWKLPLGSALRMPNSISQGACQQLGLGFEEQRRCDWKGPPATLLRHCPRRGSPPAAARCQSTRGHLLPEPGRRNPAEAGNRAPTPPAHPRPPARPRALSFGTGTSPGSCDTPSPSHPPFWTVGTVALSSLPPTPRCLCAVLSPNYRCPRAGCEATVAAALESPPLWGPPRARPTPARSPGAALLRARDTYSAPRLRTGDLVSPPALPAVRLARRRRPRAGKPGSARGAARKWPPGRTPRRRRRRHHRPGPPSGYRRAPCARLADPLARVPRTGHPRAGRLRTCHPRFPGGYTCVLFRLLLSVPRKAARGTTPAHSMSNHSYQEFGSCSLHLDEQAFSALQERKSQISRLSGEREGPVPSDSTETVCGWSLMAKLRHKKIKYSAQAEAKVLVAEDVPLTSPSCYLYTREGVMGQKCELENASMQYERRLCGY